MPRATSLPVGCESTWSGHSQKEQNEVVISRQVRLLLPQPLFQRFKDEIVSCHSLKSLYVIQVRTIIG